MCVPVQYNWFTPIPPEGNMIRTCGAPPTPQDFATYGLNTAYKLHLLASEFLSDRRSLRILDWGIGTGRVAVPLKRLLRPDAQILGVDVDRVNAQWCQESYPDIETVISDFFPPLDLEPSSIDMVYGISVMTHLTEGAQYAWLKELRRILKPGGLCVLTTHGEYALAKSPECGTRVVLEQLNLIGISDLMLDQILGPELDMKKYYRATLQTRKQVEEQWTRFLDLVAFYTAGHKVFQDLIVLRKTARATNDT
jgi:SAM-dependent methyltransferase